MLRQAEMSSESAKIEGAECEDAAERQRASDNLVEGRGGRDAQCDMRLLNSELQS